MAVATITAKLAASLQVYDVASSASNRPDSLAAEFTAKKRTENTLRTISASGTLTLAIADLGLSTCDLIKVEILTVDKSATIRFNGDPTGFTLVPVTTGETAFLIASADWSSLEIVNLDATVPIDVAITALQKAA